MELNQTLLDLALELKKLKVRSYVMYSERSTGYVDDSYVHRTQSEIALIYPVNLDEWDKIAEWNTLELEEMYVSADDGCGEPNIAIIVSAPEGSYFGA